MVRYILSTIGAFIVLILIMGFFLPGDYHVERSAHIDAPATHVYEYFNDLSEWPVWSPLIEEDKDINYTFSKTPSGEGAWLRWDSPARGTGRIDIINSNQDKLVEYEVDYAGNNMKATGVISLNSEPGGGTKVTWTNSGELGWQPWNRLYGLFLSNSIGNDFEKGLNNINRELNEGNSN